MKYIYFLNALLGGANETFGGAPAKIGLDTPMLTS